MPTFPFATGPKEKLKDSPRLRKHGSGVLGMVNVAIGGLDDMDALATALKDLGKRHKNYKATVPQFEVCSLYITKISRTLKYRHN